MPISETIKEALRLRAGGKCECMMSACPHHTGRCDAMLGPGWEAHRIRFRGSYTLGNLKAMCQTCHRNTPSYERG